MEQDSSVFVPGINCFCWECREAESCALEMVTPARFLLVLPKKHPAAVYLFVSLVFVCPPTSPVYPKGLTQAAGGRRWLGCRQQMWLVCCLCSSDLCLQSG